MPSRPSSVRLVPEPRPEYGGYRLDAFVVELRETPEQLEFSFQLGQGLGIYRASAARQLEPLALWHVDGAAYTLPDPELVARPWRAEVPRLAWAGDLGRLGNGDVLVAVRTEVHPSPASYRVEWVTRAPDGRERTTVLAWRETPAELLALPSYERADALDTALRRMARADAIDVAGIGMAYVEAGELFDGDFIDGAQYAAVCALRDAAIRGDHLWLRHALGYGLLGVPPGSPAQTPARGNQSAATAVPVPGDGPPLRCGRALRGHRRQVSAAAFSPDGQWLATADEGGTLLVRGAQADATGQHAQKARIETGMGASRAHVRGVAWAPGGRSLATHEGATVRLRDADTFEVRAERGPLGTGPLAWGSGGAWLAVLGAHGVSVLDGTTLAERDPVLVGGEVLGASPTAFAVDAGEGWIAVIDAGTQEESAMGLPTSPGTPLVLVHTMVAGAPQVDLLRGERASAVAFEPWRGALLIATFGGNLWRWEGREAPVHLGQPCGAQEIRTLAVTERWVVLAPNRPPREATLEVFAAEPLAHAASLPVPAGITPRWIATSPDGRTLATPEPPEGRDFGVRLWSLEP